MHIIFGDVVSQINQGYTVLELDTMRFLPKNQLIKTWCVVENIPLAEFPVLDHNKKIHNDLIEQYRRQDWNFCEKAIEALKGKWDGELDSFYDELTRRIQEYKQQPMPSDWDWTIPRVVQG
jgi:hypothetical protein